MHYAAPLRAMKCCVIFGPATPKSGGHASSERLARWPAVARARVPGSPARGDLAPCSAFVRQRAAPLWLGVSTRGVDARSEARGRGGARRQVHAGGALGWGFGDDALLRADAASDAHGVSAVGRL